MFKLPLDESLYIWQSDDHLKLSSDARTLSDFAPIHNNRVVCDMGCGVGNISMLIHRKKNVKILAFDVQEEAVDIFSRTVREQNLSDITPFVADIRDCPIPHDSVDYCVCNPPYTDSWIPKEKDSLGVAMHVGVSFHDIAKCAYNMLKDGGSFCTVLRVDKMPEMLEALRENRVFHIFFLYCC